PQHPPAAIAGAPVLVPLDGAMTFLAAGQAAAGPCRGILGVRTPMPHPASPLRIEVPATVLAWRGPVDLQRIRLLDAARPCADLGGGEGQRRDQNEDAA